MSAIAAGVTITREDLTRKRYYEFRSMSDVLRVLQMLREERSTGHVSINISQGACSSACFEERVKIDMPST